MDKERAMRAVEELLKAMGEDIQREGLVDTPRRVAQAFEEFTSGNGGDAGELLSRTFTAETDGLVLEKDIEFSSVCEHHLMPFFGKVAIAYIPRGKVVGLSKLARCVEVYAKRLQMQERFTAEIADAVMTYLEPAGVMVVAEAEHTCMTCRGVCARGTKTVTTCVRGDFSDKYRDEVLSLLK
ncbi:MAG: GTP cyclohydrolase I FolE [Clostridia bacterium]|nr:GTP cyclohydrolase I FolE [Clostridia bacterium]